MEAFVILLIAVGVIAFAVCVAKSLDLNNFAPNARPLDEQGPIHVLDQIALEESRSYSPFALRVLGSQKDVFSDLVKRAQALKRTASRLVSARRDHGKRMAAIVDLRPRGPHTGRRA